MRRWPVIASRPPAYLCELKRRGMRKGDGGVVDRQANDAVLSVMVAHPSPDLYGSDRQLIEDLIALQPNTVRTSIYMPATGPLSDLLAAQGLPVHVVPFPVLRRALLSALGVVHLTGAAASSVWRLTALIRREKPDVLYVNTVTIPWWVLAGRLARVPVVVHVREAEADHSRLVRWVMNAPLLLADAVVANSQASRRTLLDAVPRLSERSSVIYNGIAGPDTVEALPDHTEQPVRLALIARLSPRKGIDVALEALATLRTQGRNIHLDICGTAYTGYEWYEKELRARAAQPDLHGAVTFLGYLNPTWPLLSTATIVLVPSRVEPFGNTAVEGLLAARPVVASATQGLVEIISNGHTGLLVPPDDPDALAAAIATLLDNPDLATKVAEQGRHEALERFSITRYHRDIVNVISPKTESTGS